MFLLSGETGAIPVRARRREAQKRIFSTCCRKAGKGHWGSPSEKAKKYAPQSKYPNSQTPNRLLPQCERHCYAGGIKF